MKLSSSSITELIRSVDPASAHGDSSTPSITDLHERAHRLTINAVPDLPEPQPQRRRPVRPVLIAAAAVAALALIVPALVPDSAPQAKAATPTPLSFAADGRDGDALLHSMVSSLRKQPGTPQARRQRGGILTTDGFALVTSETAKGSATSAWFSKKITNDIEIDAASGHATTRTTSEESQPHFANDTDRQTWIDNGAGGGTGARSTVEPSTPETTDWYTQPPLAAKSFLAEVYDRQSDRSTDALLNGIAEDLATTVLEPSQRADLLDELAAHKDLRYVGTTTDRAGRAAYGFAYDSDRSGLPTRHILLISAEGNLLSYEQILTRDAGNLNVAIPATISYSLYISAQYR